MSVVFSTKQQYKLLDRYQQLRQPCERLVFQLCMEITQIEESFYPSLNHLLTLRLIAIERLGLGLSTPHPNKTLSSWVDDKQEFIQADHFALMFLLHLFKIWTT